ncbi:MAG: carboxylating nicotinate-nucleotide diphosphorylase [Flavobacterium sp.]|nr:carboxylating nicotinate-nucleotide diphosphorylase [Flavobacterium sp.]
MEIDIKSFITNALSEDIGNGDVTSLATINLEQTGEAIFNIKEDCVIAGIELAKLICNQIDPRLIFSFKVKDGEFVSKNTSIGNITGSIQSILKSERLILNCMQRMSAIATKTNYYVNLIAPYNVKLLDTRKTTPNFRVCEKWAVKMGGGVNHRFGLFDQILIKDNHIKAAGDIKNAIESCINYLDANNLQIPVIVEVKNLEEFNCIKNYEIVDRILVDNFKPEEIIELIKHNTTNKTIEASGGINATNIVDYAKTGIHYVSLGDLTHHVNSIDISLKII